MAGNAATATANGNASIKRDLTRKPPKLPIIAANIPPIMRETPRWLGWRWEPNENRDKWTKPPIDIGADRRGSSTDAATWCNFPTALAAADAGFVDGIGFALGDGFCGADFDNCRDRETGIVAPDALAYVHRLGTYGEVSPSGEGVKLILRGTLPKGRRANGNIEVYDSGRYFTVTGHRLDCCPADVAENDQELAALHRELIEAVETVSQHRRESRMDDRELALAALAALSPARAETYHDWLLVGMALHAADAGLVDAWDGWSQQSAKYSPGCCVAKWPSFNGSAVGLGSLIHWAKADTGWTPPQLGSKSRTATADAAQGERPKVDTSERDFSIITPQAWAALRQANEPPKLFRFGAVASRIERGDKGEPIIKPLGFDMMRHHLARAAAWIEWRKVGDNEQEKITAPPKDVVADVLATPDQPLPVLARIVEAPVFAPDGTLQTSPGYHTASETYYSPAAGFSVPDVPERPDGIDIEKARILIVDELLGDFPFVSDPENKKPSAELAHAVAAMLLPFARDLIDGPTPLHLFEKPSPGTGATLLVDMLSAPFTGRPIPTMTEGRDEDEWRKRITAKLSGGSPFVLIDNLRRRLDSAAVSAGITSTTWEDRILGVSVMARLPVRCVWLATGNNPAVSTEIARRTVRIRMDAKLDRPWLREGFRHDNLRQWATDNRSELVWAALTLIRAWIAQGRPAGGITLGMFERWSEVMGGILSVAGVPGFLSNLTEFYEESDAEGATWRAFLAAWWERFRENETTVKELWQIAADDACLTLGDKGEQSQRIVLGKMLADRRDRVFDLEIGGEPMRLELKRGETYRRAFRWKLRAMPTV